MQHNLLLFLLLNLVSICSCASTRVIRVIDDLGCTLTSYTAYQYNGDKQVACNIEGIKTMWSISPIVDQVNINAEGVITIHTNTLLPRTVFTIHAIMEEEEVALPFEISVRKCEFGSTMTLELITEGATNLFQLYNDTALVYNDTLTTQTFCIPHTHYRYTYIPTLDTYLRVYRDEKAFYHTGFLGRDKPSEGFFSNVETESLAISFPSVVSIAANAEKKLLISTSGLVESISIDPPLPFDASTSTVTISGNERKATIYTITAISGTARANRASSIFTVYLDTCPENYRLLKARVFDSYTAYALPDVETALSYDKDQTFCMASYSFHIEYYNKQSGDTSTLLLEEEGSPIFRFLPENRTPYFYSFAFTHAPVIAFNSTLSFFVGNPSRHWADLSFKTKGWNEGSAGNWGAFDRRGVAYFRGTFAVESVADFSYVVLKLMGEGEATVYLNGAEQGTQTLSLTAQATRVVLLSSFLQPGTNCLAVQLRGSAGSVIHFALQAEPTNTPPLPLKDGVASDMQEHADPDYPPENAFADSDAKAWRAMSFPAELVFTFSNVEQVVNQVVMPCPKGGKTFTLQIFGVTGDRRERLAAYNDEIFEGGEWGDITLSFGNVRAFHAYHLRFDRSANDTLDVKRVRFFSRALFACPKHRGLTGVLEGSAVTQRCPLGFTGRKMLYCERDETTRSSAVWREDLSECFVTNPDSGLDFVDWSFVVEGMPTSEWERRQKQLTEMLVENTYLREKNIRFLYQEWNTEQEKTAVTVTVRCTMDTLFGELIQRDLKRLAPVFDETVKEAVSTAFQARIESVRIRHHVNWAAVITVTVVVVLLSSVGFVYYTLRTKKGVTLRRLKKDALLA